VAEEALEVLAEEASVEAAQAEVGNKKGGDHLRLF